MKSVSTWICHYAILRPTIAVEGADHLSPSANKPPSLPLFFFSSIRSQIPIPPFTHEKVHFKISFREFHISFLYLFILWRGRGRRRGRIPNGCAKLMGRFTQTGSNIFFLFLLRWIELNWNFNRFLFGFWACEGFQITIYNF